MGLFVLHPDYFVIRNVDVSSGSSSRNDAFRNTHTRYSSLNVGVSYIKLKQINCRNFLNWKITFILCCMLIGAQNFTCFHQKHGKTSEISFDLDLCQWPWPPIKSIIVWKGRPSSKTYVTVFELTEYLLPGQNNWVFFRICTFLNWLPWKRDLWESPKRVPEWHQAEVDSVCCTDAKTAKTYL